MVVGALREKYLLPSLLKRFRLPRSGYYYQETPLEKQDKYSGIRKRIPAFLDKNSGRYGYRRTHVLLSREGTVASEKVVCRIIAEEEIVVRARNRRNYNSFQGQISFSVPNAGNRNFYAGKPSKKWLTNITQFVTPVGKVRLSQIVDCFDGMLPCWTVGMVSDAALVNNVLDGAILQLGEAEHPIVRSDKGRYYRWPGWISYMEEAGLERSMSKKGYFSDNSACEGLFGRLKNEMFYNRERIGISVQGFIDILNEYLVQYNEQRIKISLGSVSPLEHRGGFS